MHSVRSVDLTEPAPSRTSGSTNDMVARMTAGAIWIPSGTLHDAVPLVRPVAIVIPARDRYIQHILPLGSATYCIE